MERKRKKNLTGHSSGVPPKRKKGTKRNETAKPADSDESVSCKPGTLSQDDVLGIAHELGSLWMMLGRALYVPDAVIDQIQADTVKVSEKCYRVLRRWQERNPSDATYHGLARALQHPSVDRVDVAVKYCGLQLASDEEEYDVDEREEEEEDEEEEEEEEEEEKEKEEEYQQQEHAKPTKKKGKKTGKVPKTLEDLVNDPSNSLDEICKRLDTPTAGLGSYENIAKYYGYDVYIVQSRFNTSPYGPSKAMILAIIAEHPDVTVESFTRVVVEQTRRENVARLLREFDSRR